MPSTQLRQHVIAKAKRVVVKVGTNAITGADGRLDHAVLADLARQIASVMAKGVSVTLVASGAIGAGMAELDLANRPKELPMLQATAAVGQGQLMRVLHDAFAVHNIKVAQVLLTRDDFENRTRYLNIRNTLGALCDYGALAIINENDAVAVDEIRFGDNDIISALVANMLRADLLVLLSVVDGVLKDGQVVELIPAVTEQTLSLASGARSKLGSGGMSSKLAAGRLVTRAGAPAAIANARVQNVLVRLLEGQKLGTVFMPARSKMSSRRRWISQAARPSGKILIDEGAAKALAQQGKSLLPSGIVAIDGRFKKGATVTVIGPSGKEIARGLVNYSSEEIDKIKRLKSSQIAKVLGSKPYDEVIHRNNMAMYS